MTFSLSGLVTPGRFSGQEVRSSHSADGSMTIAESEIILATPRFFVGADGFGRSGSGTRGEAEVCTLDTTLPGGSSGEGVYRVPSIYLQISAYLHGG
jgi:hypothetical protein